MKTVKKGVTYERHTNDRAAFLVATFGWRYCPKRFWKRTK